MKFFYVLFFSVLWGACLADELASQLVDNHHRECVRTAEMPKHYKIGNYRGPTPECVPNGKTIDTKALQQLIAQQDPVLIDVLSVMRRPESAFGGSWLPNKERLSLPTAQWLPNVGYGVLDDEMKHYLSSQLSKVTKGNQQKEVVFFCIADCWMSWNAVQRAYEMGYHNVYWYKNGTDGWREAGLARVKIDPVPLEERE